MCLICSAFELIDWILGAFHWLRSPLFRWIYVAFFVCIQDGNTPAHFAAFNGFTYALIALFAAGANVNAVTGVFLTPLTIRCPLWAVAHFSFLYSGWKHACSFRCKQRIYRCAHCADWCGRQCQCCEWGVIIKITYFLFAFYARVCIIHIYHFAILGSRGHSILQDTLFEK